MLVQVNKLQKIQKMNDWRVILGEAKLLYKEYSPILNILKINKEI